MSEGTPEDQWRNLAFQFDAHRIEALSMLQYVAASETSYDAMNRIGEIKGFLSRPPLSGEKVLAQRLKDIAKAEGRNPRSGEPS